MREFSPAHAAGSLGVDDEGGPRQQRVREAGENTAVRVEREAVGERGRDGEVVVVLRVGVQRRHVRVAMYHHRRVVHQIRRLREKRVCEQIHTAQLPRAVLRIARDVLKAIVVPRLVVLHPDPLRLAHGEPAQANHLLQRHPRLLVAVARLHCELSRRSVALEGMERQRERRHPLATRVIEGHLPVVATGVAHHHALRRLVRRAGGVPADSRGSDGEIHHARHLSNAEQVQGAVEHGGGL